MSILTKTKNHIRYICKNRLFYLVLGLILVVCFLFKAGSNYLDSDTWFIMTEGRSIVENGFSYTNQFTAVEGLEAVVQQWLWDVIVYACYYAAGQAGLFLLVLVTVILTAALLYILSGYVNMDKPLRVLLTVLAMFMLSDYFSPRPNLANFDLLLLELVFLEQYKKTGDTKLLISLPVLSLVTINLHASMWVMLFLFALPYVFPAFRIFIAHFSKREYKVKPILYALVPSAAALFVNPYGLGGILYLFRSYGNNLTTLGIAELQNVAITSEYGGLIIVAVAFYAAVYIGMKREIAPERGYLFLGLTVLGCLFYRNVGYAVIAAFILMMDFLENTDFKKFHDFANKQGAPVILLAVAGLAYGIYNGVGSICTLEDGVATPLAAVEYMDGHTEKGTAVYTSFNQGAYMEWSGYTIYIDARPELYFQKINKKEDVIDEYKMLIYSLTLEEYEAFKEKYGFPYYLVQDGSLLGAYLETDGDFEAVVDGTGYTLYEEKGAGSNG